MDSQQQTDEKLFTQWMLAFLRDSSEVTQPAESAAVAKPPRLRTAGARRWVAETLFAQTIAYSLLC